MQSATRGSVSDVHSPAHRIQSHVDHGSNKKSLCSITPRVAVYMMCSITARRCRPAEPQIASCFAGVPYAVNGEADPSPSPRVHRHLESTDFTPRADKRRRDRAVEMFVNGGSSGYLPASHDRVAAAARTGAESRGLPGTCRHVRARRYLVSLLSSSGLLGSCLFHPFITHCLVINEPARFSSSGHHKA